MIDSKRGFIIGTVASIVASQTRRSAPALEPYEVEFGSGGTITRLDVRYLPPDFVLPRGAAITRARGIR